MGWETLSFHLTRRHGTLDLDGDSLSDEKLQDLEDICNQRIRELLPVSARFVSRSEYEAMAVRSRRLPAEAPDRIRIVSIEGIDDNTCGGLHVANLGELQSLRLIRAERIKGGAFRVLYRCGEALLSSIRAMDTLLDAVRDRLGCGRDDFLATLDARALRSEATRRARKRLAEFTIDLLAGTPAPHRLFIPGLDI